MKRNKEAEIVYAIDEVIAELRHGSALHGDFHSAHEGWAVIYEEVDELWEVVRMKRSARPPGAMYSEAKQVAAMALKFMLADFAKP